MVLLGTRKNWPSRFSHAVKTPGQVAIIQSGVKLCAAGLQAILAMKFTVYDWTWSPLLAIVLLAGCGGGDVGDKGAENKNVLAEVYGSVEPAKTVIKSYEIADLPPVDEPLQRPLDGGRLEICPPSDWGFFSQANYLVVFAKGKVSELPRLTVAAVASPYGDEDTSEENAPTLAKRIQARLVKDKNRIVRENPKPVVLGGRVWVRHVRQVSQGGSPCAVQSLQIVRDGRLYTLELFSAAKSDSPAHLDAAVTRHRDDAYAVAANVRFTKETGSAAPPVAAASEKPTVEKPAEPKPAEQKNE